MSHYSKLAKATMDFSHHVLLCVLQVYANGMVTVKPDFSSGKPAYRLENKHRGIECPLKLLFN